MTLSPTAAVIWGIGHWPFIPMVGREKPSGCAVTHVILKSWVTVAATLEETKRRKVNSSEIAREYAILQSGARRLF